MAKKSKVIQPGPVPGLPITQRGGGKKRPSMGTGIAEKGARDVETRQTKQDRAIRRMAQGKPPK